MLVMVKSFIIKSLLNIKDIAYYYKLKFQYRNEINKKIKNKPKKLNKHQITKIKRFYSNYGYNNVSTSWHDFYYSSNNVFSVEYVPEDVFHATISKKLNQMRQWPSLLDKNLLGLMFKDYHQPEVVLRNMNGFYFIEGEIVSESIAFESIFSETRQMVIKPSIDSGCGHGIVLFSTNDGFTNYNGLSVKNLLCNYGKDFIVQVVVNQNEALKSLNPSSLNTLRVLSYLNKNGVYVLSTIVRVGKKGSFTDNCATGGIACGVDEYGKLKKYGYLNDGTERSKTDIGTLLEGLKVPSYNKVIDKVKKMHLLIPYFRIVSWDIGVDSTGIPILIEYNTYHQDITIHQLANGPLFGAFTDEILNIGSKQY
jgi:hypothetical protein